MRQIKFNAYIPDLEIILEDITLYGTGMMGIGEDKFKEALPKNVRLDWDSDMCGYTDVIRDITDMEDEFKIVMKVLQGEDWIWIEENEFIPLQLTCLSDMNGKILFEKDIIRFKYKDSTIKEGFGHCYGVIEFENGSFVVKEPGFKYTDEQPETLYNWLKDEQCECVGNYIINPELIQFNN